MSKKKNDLEFIREKNEETIKITNMKIEELGKYAKNLYSILSDIQEEFDKIRNIPSEKEMQYEELKKIKFNWKHQSEKVEEDYKNALLKSVGKGAFGIGMGVAVVSFGPTTAMGIATTFGVASTGTAISSLSGAAATNAALAWLGGGALAIGGGGIAGGNALLTLAGPIGWAIGGVSLLSSAFLLLKTQKEKKRLEDIFTLIAKRDVKTYELAIVELNERISHIKDENNKLNEALEQIKLYGVDYSKMTTEQQFALGSYLNLMQSSTKLLVNPIIGLQPKYDEEDYESFIIEKKYIGLNKSLIIALANLLYKIDLDEKDKKVLWKSLKNNKEMLKSFNINKKEFKISIIEIVCEAIQYK